MFEIRFTHDAFVDISRLRPVDRRRVIAGIEAELAHLPTIETRNRKRLRPNQLAEWELRIGNLRVFYDVDGDAAVVSIVACGVKQRDRLVIRDKEWRL